MHQKRDKQQPTNNTQICILVSPGYATSLWRGAFLSIFYLSHLTVAISVIFQLWKQWESGHGCSLFELSLARSCDREGLHWQVGVLWRCHQQEGLLVTRCAWFTLSPFSVSHPQVVRVWFCNRRQKGKRLLLPYGNEAEGMMYDMNQPLVPSTLPIPVTSQGYSLAPSPPVYMPTFHKAEMFPQALQPGLSMSNSGH